MVNAITIRTVESVSTVGHTVSVSQSKTQAVQTTMETYVALRMAVSTLNVESSSAMKMEKR